MPPRRWRAIPPCESPLRGCQSVVISPNMAYMPPRADTPVAFLLLLQNVPHGQCTAASVLFGYRKPFTARMCPLSDDISLWRQPAEHGKPDLQHGARGAQHMSDFRSRCRLDTHKVWASNWVMTGPRSLCAQHPRRPPPAAAPAAPRSPQMPRHPPMR